MTPISDSWFTVQEIDAKTFAISEYGHWERVHSFLLMGNENAALIDTGLGIDQINRITDQLTDLPIIVITTHVHADHIGSHGAFEKIYVHEDEVDWLINGIKGLPIEQIRKDIGRDITKPTPDTFDPSTYTPYQGKPTGVLVDGDRIDLGHRTLKILHTPGHSPGHICIFDKEQGYLFTGDLLYIETPVYAFYPTTDPIDLVHSLERIAHMEGVSRVFGSHNKLGLDPSILEEVQESVDILWNKDVVKHGTGIHTFNHFCVQF
ncbi:MBL fold metallo-hydrolase [Virgibacillus sp. NKC19-3]|uniref:MBL fold metallo-hydrolase n=1 Tax=Virgibacillus saliphilus TaxID=2831674 RepID=UPI001C9B686B|nr:MBL fold metallo-hydrolase [Virgibacillus sp. NKC19-3]MBY7142770.1 MBL fold metallo-hydrolase [Virgibacillus sp. NKC19-3]